MTMDDLPLAVLATVDVGDAEGVLDWLAIDRRRIALVARSDRRSVCRNGLTRGIEMDRSGCILVLISFEGV